MCVSAMAPYITCRRTWRDISNLRILHQPVSLTLLLDAWQVHSPRILEVHLSAPLQIECNKTACGADELPLALDAYSDTHDLWPNLSEHFPSVSDPPQAFAIICQPRITIVNSHNYSPHVCEPPAMLPDIFQPFPTPFIIEV